MSDDQVTSIPKLSEFNPNAIPYQMQVIRDVRRNFDYTKGVHEILLSGAVGSAKSILMAHLVVTHCLLFPGARGGIGRQSMPDLKGTLLSTLLEHIDGEVPYRLIKSSPTTIYFPNGSTIQCFSWRDGKYKKFRSYPFSIFAIEELTENDDDEFYREIKMRLGRMPHIPEQLLISATNPGDPEHFAFSRFDMAYDEEARAA